MNKANGQCKTKEEIIESPKYYLIDETHAGVCSKDIENCMSCDNVTYCTQCKLSYIFDNDLNKCVNKSTYEDAEVKEKAAGEEGSTKENQKEETQSGRRKVKKKKNGSNYFSISNIIILEIIYVIFLLIKL